MPLDTFSWWNKYDLSSLFDAGPGVLGAGIGVVYNAKFFPEINNAVIVPGYARVDGALYVKLSEKVSAQLNVENLAGRALLMWRRAPTTTSCRARRARPSSRCARKF